MPSLSPILPVGLMIGPPRPDDSFTDLVVAVVDDRPDYVPERVTNPDLDLGAWFDRKTHDWQRVARVGSSLVAHVGVRAHRELPNVELPDGSDLELTRLMVHPRYSGHGIATLLVKTAESAFGDRLWAVLHKHGPARRIFDARGWETVGEVSWPEDPGPGLVMVASRCPAPRGTGISSITLDRSTP